MRALFDERSYIKSTGRSQFQRVGDDSYQFLFNMDDFSSNQFCGFYLNVNGVFQPTIRINSIDKIITLSTLEDGIDNVVDIINDNGGFTVIGWYKT